MSRMKRLVLAATLLISSVVSAGELKGFKEKFSFIKNDQGQIQAIRLKKAITTFSLKPLLEQLKNDLIKQQSSFNSLSFYQQEDLVSSLVADIYPDAQGESNSVEAEKLKEALLNIPQIDIEEAFNKLGSTDFWKQFEMKLKDAMMFIDPTILVNLEDARFFYKKNVTYTVVEWALKEAQKRFSDIPVLNMATFIIVRAHDMMLEQRLFHHNMLLHYFEVVPETELGMTKEEVDRAVSSIYEYKIQATNFLESNRAAADWLNYGMNQFYRVVRAGQTKMNTWKGPLSDVRFENIKKINFAFAQVTEENVQKIYHLHLNAHMLSSKPSLAYDFSNPQRIKRNRALLNLGGLALGFIKMPGWLKSNVDSFIKSFYVEQVRLEGALVAHFDLQSNDNMVDQIYNQRANFYIVR